MPFARAISGDGAAVDENTRLLTGGGVVAHHDVCIAALLEVRIEDHFAGRAPAPFGYPGESGIVH
jgi:hypothetical protein